MNDNLVILEAAEFVKKYLLNESSGHDWWHIERVWRLSTTIAQEEGADLKICQLAAIFHDMMDDKIFPDVLTQENLIKEWLISHHVSFEDVNHILTIIHTMSFKAHLEGKTTQTLEAKVVQDADRIDALGAIGIARTMAYSGNKGRLIHDPLKTEKNTLTRETYRSNQDTAVMHFYDKLLKLKELMNTNYGKKIAEQRHQFMEKYLEEFFLEWDGKR